MRTKLNGLHAFRAIASLGVFFHHIEEFKKHSDIISIGSFKGVNALGGTSVTAFFVLSGFLLSYLLMIEKEKTSTIKRKYFYLRRFLRIWPLYFVTLLLYKCLLPVLPLDIMEIIRQGSITNEYEAVSSIVIPNWLEWGMLLLFLPHVLLSLGILYNPAHVWSIGVEVIFYLFLPLAILYTKNYLKSFLIILITYMLLISGALFVFVSISKTHDPNSWIYLSSKFVFGFLYFERISSMAIGAIAAYLFLFQKERSLKVIKSYYLFLPSMLLLAYMLLKGIVLPILTNEIYSVLFAILSIHMITNTSGIFKLFNNKVLDFLGNISYGIYMYNPFVLLITIELFLRLGLDKSSFLNSFVYFYIFAFTFTILISYLSYRFIEEPFLKLRKYNSS